MKPSEAREGNEKFLSFLFFIFRLETGAQCLQAEALRLEDVVDALRM
jgi:hypothetical protein